MAQPDRLADMTLDKQTVQSTESDGWGDDAIFADFMAEPSVPEEMEPTLHVESLRNALSRLQIPTDDASDLSDPPECESVACEPCETVSDAVADTVPDAPADTSSNTMGIKPAELGRIECPELAEAFLDDAGRGIAALDQAVIDYESNNNRDDALGQIGRELHTLKGAAAVIGLTDTGRYLHDIEDFVQSGRHSPAEITDVPLDCLDTLRRQVAQLDRCPADLNGGDAADAKPQDTFAAGGRSESSSRIETVSDGEDSISVKGEQLDRLLDMLTSLTMLDNQRDSRIDQFREVNANLTNCGNRIRDLGRVLSKVQAGDERVDSALRSATNPLQELANDLGEIGRLLQDACRPIRDEHVAMSNFIRQFRHALVSVMRMPVTGMFRRLQRAALDAARVERKQVRLEVIGSEAGLERSVQERLLDPLMHIVRNAVSHGIESPEDRRSQGKDQVGTITLEAISAPNLLTLNVRDDGRGLDYESLRRKGTELGLLQNGRDASHEELGQLIFHRGFSTRSEANEVAGRGVGMDVVADTLEKLHSWVEVESKPGEGTTIRLTVPLKSITEHALVVRSGDYLIALPMQFVRSAEDQVELKGELPPSIATALGLRQSNRSGSTNVVTIERTSSVKQVAADEQSISFSVDEILGPQEVVVRPLPSLFRHQQLFSGVTLAANGQIAFMLHPHRLATVLASLAPSEDAVASEAQDSYGEPDLHVLIIDDSLSARKALSSLCCEQGWVAHEAKNGIEGLEMLGQQEWAAIVTDYDMPQMNGIKFIESLRNDFGLTQVPVLMVSSRDAEEMESRALAAGATQYVTKPLAADQLEQLLAARTL